MEMEKSAAEAEQSKYWLHPNSLEMKWKKSDTWIAKSPQQNGGNQDIKYANAGLFP